MKSRFLNVQPRAYIRQKDSVNILPKKIRTGYQNELGISSSSFSDSETVIFRDNSSVLAPYMIPQSRAAQSGFLTGTIVLNAKSSDSSTYLEEAVIYESIFPYKERTNTAAFNLNEQPGFPEGEYPGFSSPDQDKSAIVIDISSNTDTVVTKLSRTSSLRDSSGPYYDAEYSGFLYYDKDNKRWQDIGLTDPALGTSLNYNPVLGKVDSIGGGTYLINDRDDSFMCQFASSPYSFVQELYYVPDTLDKARARGYDKIGEPTSFFGAPYSPRYHAKKQNSIKLSDYITSPFVVDRISVSIPVRAYRTQNPPYHLVGPNLYDAGYGHDIDNYVFFVYVQNRTNAQTDTSQDVSGSIRHLVGKTSFSFYNRPTFGTISNLMPIHDYSIGHNFNMSLNFASSSNTVKTLFADFDVNVTFRPTTYGNFFGATSKIPISNPVTTVTNLTGSVFIQQFWRGGQIASGSKGSILSARLSDGSTSTLYNQRSTNIPGRPQELQTSVSPRAITRTCWNGTDSVFVTGSGLGSANVDSIGSSKDLPVKQTPIVLFPSDELVFGFESGVNANMKAGPSNTALDQSVLAITGSRLIIRSGQAQVTLYGAPMKEGRELLPSLNQYLGSDAVHETIQSDDVIDQFDILDKSILSASYVDGTFVGNLLKQPQGRTRTRLFSSGKYGVTASLQRNVKMYENQAIYYDTFIPASSVIVDGLQNSSFGPNLADEPAVKLTAILGNGYVVENERQSDVLLFRPFVFEREGNQPRQRDVTVSLINRFGTYTDRFTGENARFALYYNGNNPFVNLSTLNKMYEGAASLRYGLMNVKLTNPSSVFRRDRYGHFRDMLEQPRFSKLVTTDTGKDVVGSAVVTALFVSQSSNVQVDPAFTQCSNLSAECTSSIPFIDDDRVHNRGALPTSIIRFGPNNLIFGVTGSFGF